MAFQQSTFSQPQDSVSGDQYRYALTNFRIAHEKVEQQRAQLEEQEKQIALLRQRISLLEGSSAPDITNHSGNSVDDFSIRSTASQLDKLINRWSAKIVRSPPVALEHIQKAILQDLTSSSDIPEYDGTAMEVQSLLRHAISEIISEGIINCLIVTNSSEANVQLTRIHEHIFARDPTVACVWRRQTFSAAVDSCTPEMAQSILKEHIPHLTRLFRGEIPQDLLDFAFTFSRMLHGSTGSGDMFYRAFVPELGSPLDPKQIELIKWCKRGEKRQPDRVGATIFPGLVKIARGSDEQNVVKRAHVICECALKGTSLLPIA